MAVPPKRRYRQTWTAHCPVHSCSVRTVRTLQLGKCSGTLQNFTVDMELYGTFTHFKFCIVGLSVVIVYIFDCYDFFLPLSY